MNLPLTKRPTVGIFAIGVFSILATYVLFLLWDQFGFLRRLESATDSDGIRIAMAAMGVAGLLASLATGALLRRRSESSVLRAGFALAAVAVPLSLWAQGLPMLSLAGAALGIATGLVTVSLASGLRCWLAGPNFTVAVGVGTGLAYFVCNVPGLFEGSGAVQAGFVSVLCLLAVGALTMAPAPSPQPSPPRGEGAKARPAMAKLPWPELSLLLAFLALVWLDSAAFAVIQETLALKGDAGVAAALAVFVVVPGGRADAALPSQAPLDLIEEGRQAYIAEGCMGCHSQYVRPRHDGDQRLYGPHRPLDRTESPPLIGLRRQGPDLSNVGQRHDADWLRHHLASPRDDRAESVMPSYRHLFDGTTPDSATGSSRGEALVAYLLSLRPDEPQAESRA